MVCLNQPFHAGCIDVDLLIASKCAVAAVWVSLQGCQHPAYGHPFPLGPSTSAAGAASVRAGRHLTWPRGCLHVLRDLAQTLRCKTQPVTGMRTLLSLSRPSSAALQLYCFSQRRPARLCVAAVAGSIWWLQQQPGGGRLRVLCGRGVQAPRALRWSRRLDQLQ